MLWLSEGRQAQLLADRPACSAVRTQPRTGCVVALRGLQAQLLPDRRACSAGAARHPRRERWATPARASCRLCQRGATCAGMGHQGAAVARATQTQWTRKERIGAAAVRPRPWASRAQGRRAKFGSGRAHTHTTADRRHRRVQSQARIGRIVISGIAYTTGRAASVAGPRPPGRQCRRLRPRTRDSRP